MPASVLQSQVVDDHVLGDIDQPSRQVSGIGCAQRGIGQTLAGTMR